MPKKKVYKTVMYKGKDIVGKGKDAIDKGKEIIDEGKNIADNVEESMRNVKNKSLKEFEDFKRQHDQQISFLKKSINNTRNIASKSLEITGNIASKTIKYGTKVAQPIKPLAQEVGKDFEVDKAGMTANILSTINPILGYLGGSAVNAYGDKLKDMFSSAFEKTKNLLSTKNKDIEDELEDEKDVFTEDDIKERLKSKKSKNLTKKTAKSFKEATTEKQKTTKGKKTSQEAVYGSYGRGVVFKDKDNVIIRTKSIEADNVAIKGESLDGTIDNIKGDIQNSIGETKEDIQKSINESIDKNKNEDIQKSVENIEKSIDEIKEKVVEKFTENPEDNKTTEEYIEKTVEKTVNKIAEKREEIIKPAYFNNKDIINKDKNKYSINVAVSSIKPEAIKSVSILDTKIKELETKESNIVTNKESETPTLFSLDKRINELDNKVKTEKFYSTTGSISDVRSISDTKESYIQSNAIYNVRLVGINDETLEKIAAAAKGELESGSKIQTGIEIEYDFNKNMLSTLTRMIEHVRRIRYELTGEKDGFMSRTFARLSDKLESFFENFESLRLVWTTLKTTFRVIKSVVLFPFRKRPDKYAKELNLPKNPLSALLSVSISQYGKISAILDTFKDYYKAYLGYEAENHAERKSLFGKYIWGGIIKPLSSKIYQKYIDGTFGRMLDDIRKKHFPAFLNTLNVIKNKHLPEFAKKVSGVMNKHFPAFTKKLKDIKDEYLPIFKKALNDVRYKYFPSFIKTLNDTKNKFYLTFTKTLVDIRDKYIPAFTKKVSSIMNKYFPKFTKTLIGLKDKYFPVLTKALNDMGTKYFPVIRKSLKDFGDKYLPVVTKTLSGLKDKYFPSFTEVYNRITGKTKAQKRKEEQERIQRERQANIFRYGLQLYFGENLSNIKDLLYDVGLATTPRKEPPAAAKAIDNVIQFQKEEAKKPKKPSFISTIGKKIKVGYGSIKDKLTRNREEALIQTPESLNEKIKNLPVKFNKPLNDETPTSPDVKAKKVVNLQEYQVTKTQMENLIKINVNKLKDKLISNESSTGFFGKQKDESQNVITRKLSNINNNIINLIDKNKDIYKINANSMKQDKTFMKSIVDNTKDTAKQTKNITKINEKTLHETKRLERGKKRIFDKIFTIGMAVFSFAKNMLGSILGNITKLVTFLIGGSLFKKFGSLFKGFGKTITGAIRGAKNLVGKGASVGGKVLKGAAEVGSRAARLTGNVLKGATSVGGKVVKGASTIGSTALKGAAKTGSKLASAARFAKFAGPAGAAITAVFAANDAISGWKDAGDIFDLEKGQNATFSQKLTASLSSALSGLTFGLVDKKKLAKSIHGFGKSILSPFTTIIGATKNVFKKITGFFSSKLDWIKGKTKGLVKSIGSFGKKIFDNFNPLMPFAGIFAPKAKQAQLKAEADERTRKVKANAKVHSLLSEKALKKYLDVIDKSEFPIGTVNTLLKQGKLVSKDGKYVLPSETIKDEIKKKGVELLSNVKTKTKDLYKSEAVQSNILKGKELLNRIRGKISNKDKDEVSNVVTYKKENFETIIRSALSDKNLKIEDIRKSFSDKAWEKYKNELSTLSPEVLMELIHSGKIVAYKKGYYIMFCLPEEVVYDEETKKASIISDKLAKVKGMIKDKKIIENVNKTTKGLLSRSKELLDQAKNKAKETYESETVQSKLEKGKEILNEEKVIENVNKTTKGLLSRSKEFLSNIKNKATDIYNGETAQSKLTKSKSLIRDVKFDINERINNVTGLKKEYISNIIREALSDTNFKVEHLRSSFSDKAWEKYENDVSTLSPDVLIRLIETDKIIPHKKDNRIIFRLPEETIYDETRKLTGTIRDRFTKIKNAILSKNINETMKNKLTKGKEVINQAKDKAREVYEIKDIQSKLTNGKELLGQTNIIKSEPIENKGVFGKVKDKIVSLYTNIKNKVTDTYANIKDKVVTSLTNIKNKITDTFTNVKNKITSIVGNIKDKVIGAFVTIKNGIVVSLTNVKNKIVEILTLLKTKINEIYNSEAIQSKKEKPVDNFNKMKNSLYKLSEKTKEGIDKEKERLSNIKEEIGSSEKVDKIKSYLIKNENEIRSKMNLNKEDFQKLINKIGELKDKTVETTTNTSNMIINILSSAMTSLSNITSGAVNGGFGGSGGKIDGTLADIANGNID